MTLTRFLTGYIYIPLGGSKWGTAHTCFNMFIVFLLSGIWHGANWTFILWGVLHGLLCIFERLFQKHIDRVHAGAKWLVTFLCVNVLWLLFRAESVLQWRTLLKTILAFQNLNLSASLVNAFDLPEREAIFRLFHLWNTHATTRGFPMILFFLAAITICLGFENNYRAIIKKNVLTAVMGFTALVWSLLCLSSESVFLYFNF